MKKIITTLLTVFVGIVSVCNAQTYSDNFIDIHAPTGIFVNWLDVDKDDNIYAALWDDYGQVYKSTDGGSHWQKVFDTSTPQVYLMQEMTRIENKRIIYKAKEINSTTGNYLGGSCVNIAPWDDVFFLISNDLYRSSDGGEKWKKLTLPSGIVKYDLAFNKINNNIFIVGDYFLDGQGWPSKPAVFRSSDNGDSWEILTNGLPDASRMQSIAIDNDGRIFAGSSGDGIYRSLDNGNTWARIMNGFWNTYVYSIAINSKGEIFAGTNGALNFSADHGDNWSYEVSYNIPGGSFDFIFIDKDDNIYTAPNSIIQPKGIYLSTNNGKDWTNINNGFTKTAVYGFTRTSDNVLFAGSEGGIYRSTDKGLSWLNISNNFTDRPIYDFFCDKDKDEIVIASRGLVTKLTDKGMQSEIIPTDKLPTGYNTGVIKTNDEIYVCNPIGVYKTSNNGQSWEFLTANLNVQLPNLQKIYLSSNGTIYSTGHNVGIIRSTDKGNTWDNVLMSDENHPINRTYAPITNFICIDDTAFVCIYNSGIWVSTDNGTTWDKFTKNLADSVFNNILYLSSTNILVSTETFSNDKVYQTKDFGNSWTEYSGYQFNEGHTLHFLDKDSNNFFVSVEGHRFFRNNIVFSDNNGASWKTLFSGESDMFDIYDIKLDSDGYIFLFGYRNHPYFGVVFRRSAHTIYEQITDVDVDTQIPTKYSLSQNYPNPFNPVTTIKYSVPENSFVTLKVHDILGREITTLVNEEKYAGNYSVTFDGSGLSSGIYFYTIKTNKYSNTKKLVLMK